MEPTEVRVYDALGQWVKTYRGTDRVFLGDLPKGLYLIKATCEDGKNCVGKVVKE
ncbi:MAG: T9SS type A sorting domain-containing protein [Bacteroidales bacterium]|nr:T9SS type A sorting domain-containing protein [Bacteroidales bacterium]